MTKNRRTLTEIFAGTDTVTYGPFSIVKPVGEKFKHAKFMVDGTEVPMEAAQKKVMALLISQQGKTLTVVGLADGMETDKFNDIARGIHQTHSDHLRQKSLQKGHRNFGTHVSYIREALINTFGAGSPETIRYLGILETVHGYSLKPFRRAMESGYRLNIGTPAAEAR